MAAQQESAGLLSFFKPDEIPWDPQSPSSRRKILRLDDNVYIAMIQWDAGYRLGHLDTHGGEETVYVLEGTFEDHGRYCGPGSIVRGDVGSRHQPSTPDGVTFLVIRSLIPGDRARFSSDWKPPMARDRATKDEPIRGKL